jgi:hypothetical protein
LALPRREVRAALAHFGVESVRERGKPRSEVEGVNRGSDLKLRRIRSRNQKVVADRPAEQETFLRYDDDAFA